MRRSLHKRQVGSTLDRAMDRFGKVLHHRSLRLTSERRAIVKAVIASKGHFEIDGLIRASRREGISASRATVYRAIPLLIEAGLVQPTVLSGKQHRYETVFGHEHHDHLICQVCEKVVEFQFEAFEILQRELAAKHGFELIEHYHELIGVCGDCKRKEESMRGSKQGPATIETRSHIWSAEVGSAS